VRHGGRAFPTSGEPCAIPRKGFEIDRNKIHVGADARRELARSMLAKDVPQVPPCSADYVYFIMSLRWD
jgi:hypothetical protein